MEIRKSSRHSKIAGDFGEAMLMYWLSKYGYEVVNVDYIGIDLIAYNKKTKERLGISVKARTRERGQAYSNVTIPSKREVLSACKIFDCEPYLAVVVDSIDDANNIRMYLLPWVEFERQCRINRQKGFKMDKRCLNKYESNPQIKKITFDYKIKGWE
ncbi:MAG: hypothetical protein ABSE81_02550 [Candidatus Omnitrophota bacterium]|jgi:Holliday junction resolvase-like predicted endonuclease